MEKNSFTKEVYFASSNSYYGFKSYFDRIFNSRDFLKIYVLKGGPGTGKSTLMKKCHDMAQGLGYECEIFYCSSDPKSLDGIIMKNRDKRVAILDGTAPHERDAVIPGAIDELVCLGNGFNVDALEKKRKPIEELNEKKNAAYRQAYKYLSFSAVFAEKIKAEIKSCFDFTKAHKHIKTVIPILPNTDCGKSDIRLVSSFSKNGYETVPTLLNISKTEYSVFGKWGSDSIYMDLLAKALEAESRRFRRFPSPLDPDRIEALAFNDENISIGCMGHGDIICDTTEFLDYHSLERMNAYLGIFDEVREKFLTLAEEELSIASKYHFMLEDIYTECMNFSIIDEIRENLFEKIKNILSA